MSSNVIRNNGVNGAGTSCEDPLSSRCPVGEQHRSGHHEKAAKTGWSKEMNIDVTECYFLSIPFDEVGKPIRGYRKQMYDIWKEGQSLKVSKA